jgi:hypothetical protein
MPQVSCMETMEPLKPSVIACRIFAVPNPDRGLGGRGVVRLGAQGYKIGGAGLVWGFI